LVQCSITGLLVANAESTNLGVSVVGGLAYVADGESGLRVIEAVPEPGAFLLQIAAVGAVQIQRSVASILRCQVGQFVSLSTRSKESHLPP
jgi:hypothetical protein